MTRRGGRHGAMTFLLRVETNSEICEELKLVRRNGKTSLIRHRALDAPLSAKCRQATYVRAMSAFQGEMSVSGHSRRFGRVPTTSALPYRQTSLPCVGMSQMCQFR